MGGSLAYGVNPSIDHIVDAAYRLFDTCRGYQSEQQEHLQAYLSANQREVELLRELHALIDALLQARAKQASEPPHSTPSRMPKVAPSAAAALAPHAAATEPFVGTHPLPPATVLAGLDASPHASGASLGAQSSEGSPAPALDIYFLSPFQVFRDDQQVTDWPNSKGKLLFKYLVANRERPVPKEVLMDVFWPGADANAARNNLNVVVYGLRKELAAGGIPFPYILFQDGCYLLNPSMHIWVDAEAFRMHLEAALRSEQSGDLEEALQHYRAAEVLYQQPFLAEDRYEEWIDPQRQSMEQAYVGMLDRLGQHYFEQKDYDACALVCRKMLGVDACNEAPHRLLMRCYARLGQPHLALRQFHICVDALSRELKLNPSLQTVDLFKRIKSQQPV